MDFHNGFKRQLLREVEVDRRSYNTAAKDAAGAPEDTQLFYELMFKRYHSNVAFNEHSRVNHMLLKTAIDGVQ
ncbi:type III secretion protein HrpF [Pseudomonas sp. CBSPBW29]|jgi:hypothetical protein|uniref:type III secretion protein HrpF n=1 Tax=Pseudomonas TaxID=286 RepID=UPI0021ACAFF2|nr:MULTISPECIES: type III secretion protein HrpF [unclassified Pseudomonas]WEL45476.1 type III secretion protein HrpF [Pseudomonas sp. CBSPBW29]WEL66580.1 type III secretion protein HrpF [Pseudomonas sp. CBSPGW29]WEL70069.1 type III secretion protein HrpF [Pseudomonas sp. CBSPCGW29]WEL77023.1 type III secretion protein HrpF [Pseudomonas sp. CBSPAW29]WEL84372.1 type III secretion protein HrpF [Pseudomonas sp. CBSPCAW29]WEL87200.1 type III secretion protein HrpF [Pseudomonas sp. CBSPCBW29]